RGTFATIVPSSRHVTDPSLPMASLGCGGAINPAHTGPVPRYPFVTFVVSWTRGSTRSLALLRHFGNQTSCWFSSVLQSRHLASASLSFRYIWRQLEQRFHVFHVTSAHFGHQDFLLVCDGSSGSEPGRRSARIPAGQTLREADTPAAQGNCASRRRTGRVRILLSLESIRTRPQLEEDAPRVGFRRVASALDDVDGEAAERCLLVLRGHIRAGLAHRLDHLVE